MVYQVVPKVGYIAYLHRQMTKPVHLPPASNLPLEVSPRMCDHIGRSVPAAELSECAVRDFTPCGFRLGCYACLRPAARTTVCWPLTRRHAGEHPSPGSALTGAFENEG